MNAHTVFRKRIFSIFLFFLPSLVFCHASDKELSGKNGWVLVWSDEFDGAVLDSSKWRIEEAALIKNNEKQYYSSDNVSLKDGMLILRSEKQKKGGREFTSGLVDTNGRFAQAFGRFEICARLPKGQGIWPAHWLLNTSGKWPPEIDILETYGKNEMVVNNIFRNDQGQIRSEGHSLVKENLSEGFHVYALEWESGEMRWFVDDALVFSTKQNIPQIPFYLILNTAVGGDFPGDPDETTEFPQEHQIDYVRIYQKEISGNKILTTSAENGWILASPDQPQYPENSEVTLTALPKIGFRFQSWSGAVSSQKNPLVLRMDRHSRIHADFVPDPDSPPLISKNKPVSASSVERTEIKPSSVTDGNLATRWSSKFQDPQWIQVDLEDEFHLSAIRLTWETASARCFEIQSSKDGKIWSTLQKTENNTRLVNEFRFESVSARYVRILCTARNTEWGYSLYEVEVFGEKKRK